MRSIPTRWILCFPVRRIPLARDAARAAYAAAVQRHGHLDDRRRGHRSRDAGRGTSGQPSGSPTNSRMLGDPHRVLVEVGPGGSLTGSAIRHPTGRHGHRAVRLMRHPLQNRSDRDTFLLDSGSSGPRVSTWTGSRLSTGQPRRVSLPGYPFARQRHWIEPPDSSGRAMFPPPMARRPAERSRDQCRQRQNGHSADAGDAAAHLRRSVSGVTSIGRATTSSNWAATRSCRSASR